MTVSRAERDRQLHLLQELNREFRRVYTTNSSIAARSRAYELAARMQLSAPYADLPLQLMDTDLGQRRLLSPGTDPRSHAAAQCLNRVGPV